jgi:hypothetical protein
VRICETKWWEISRWLANAQMLFCALTKIFLRDEIINLAYAKTIPDDISKSNEAVLAMLQKIKANGATLSSDLLDSLKK